MHDPMTVAHEIKLPWKWRGHRPTILTIWHVDPEKDGSDDSCGWFMRARHCDQEKLDKIARDFEFQWSHGVPEPWFNKDGDPNYSPQAITLGMFRIAANVHFGHWSWRADAFLRRNVFDILHFAENSCDSLYTFIVQPWGQDDRDTPEKRARAAACIVYSWICRADRPWWKHPKWHWWHWHLQFHPWQQIKRYFWDRCAVCGKRGFYGQSAIGNWDGDRIWHAECDDRMRQQHTAENGTP